MSDKILKAAEELCTEYKIRISEREARALEAIITTMTPEASLILHRASRLSSGRDPSDQRGFKSGGGGFGKVRTDEQIARKALITHLFSYGLATTLLKLSENEPSSLYGIESEAHKLELRATTVVNAALIRQEPMPSADTLKAAYDASQAYTERRPKLRAEHNELLETVLNSDISPTERDALIERLRALDL